MSHKQQVDYCIKIKSLFPSYFKRKVVLDIGSLDVNGNNRYLFDDCIYLGVDIGPGKNVDIVHSAHNLPFDSERCDIIISTEVAEHDKYWKETMLNAIRMLRPGGMLLFTCATTGRPEHGTRRTDEFSSPYTTDYYCNVTEEMIRSIPGFADAFKFIMFSVNNESHDLQLTAIKTGGKDIKFNPSLYINIKTRFLQFYLLRIRDGKELLKRLYNKFK